MQYVARKETVAYGETIDIHEDAIIVDKKSMNSTSNLTIIWLEPDEETDTVWDELGDDIPDVPPQPSPSTPSIFPQPLDVSGGTEGGIPQYTDGFVIATDVDIDDIDFSEISAGGDE